LDSPSMRMGTTISTSFSASRAVGQHQGQILPRRIRRVSQGLDLRDSCQATLPWSRVSRRPILDHLLLAVAILIFPDDGTTPSSNTEGHPAELPAASCSQSRCAISNPAGLWINAPNAWSPSNVTHCGTIGCHDTPTSGPVRARAISRPRPCSLSARPRGV